MNTVIATRENLPRRLAETIFVDRGHQFVDRLKWNLCVTPEGLETDAYDDDQSEYIAIHRAGKHMGSCRVRPTQQKTMIEDHFLGAFPNASGFLAMQKGRIYELTRFCRAPDISVCDSKAMLALLAQLLDQFRDQRRLTGYVAVVFPQIARFLDSIGVRYLLIDKSRIDGKSAYLICITHAVRVDVPLKAAANLPKYPGDAPLAA